MTIDLIGLALIIIFFIRGYMKGIIVAVFSLIAIVLGVICALKLSGMLADWLMEKGWITSGWAQVFSYLILFFGVLILVKWIAKYVQSAANLTMLGWLNNIIGGLVYAFMAAIIWSSVLWLLNRMHIITEEMIAKSRTYEYLEPLAPWIFDKIGNLLPFVGNIFNDLQHFFDKANNKLS